MAGHGYRLPTGTLVDSSVVQVPRQRNSREENVTLKSGEVPTDWNDRPNLLYQKDKNARWFKKHGVSHFGYKNHIAVDRATKVITNWEVSPEPVHNSQVFEVLLDAHPPKGHEVSPTVPIVRRKDFLVYARRSSSPGSRTRLGVGGP